jgi:hypothetical protein
MCPRGRYTDAKDIGGAERNPVLGNEKQSDEFSADCSNY